MVTCYQKIMDDLTGSFWTKCEFEKMLLQYAETSELDGVAFSVTYKGEEPIEYGQKLDKPTKATFSILDDPEITCSIWSDFVVDTHLQEEIKKIVCEYLQLPFAGGCQLPFYGTEKTKEKCNSTLQRFISTNTAAAVFMVDLDHFKEVNDRFDHTKGSAVLVQFGNMLRRLCQDQAVVIHRSGDEFFLLMPFHDAFEPLRLAYQIREATNKYPFFCADEINLTAAQGICLCFEKRISFEEAANMAENAYNSKRKNRSKERDSVRLFADQSKLPPRGETDRAKAFAVAMTHLKDNCIFRNPYLDLLSNYVSNIADKGNFQETVDCVTQWMNPDDVSGMQVLSKSAELNLRCEWSGDEFAFVLLHGLMRNEIIGRQSKFELSFYGTQGFIIRIDDRVIYQSGKITGETSESFSVIAPTKSASRYADRTAVLVQIGFQELPIPEDCFYRVIHIDSRATIGGSLPDFWAAALSELIELLWKHPFICHVIVYGKREHGKIFCDIIEHSEEWGTEKYPYSFLAKKTQRKIEWIQNGQKRLKGAVQFVSVDRGDSLVSALVDIGLTQEWADVTQEYLTSSSHHSLTRNLNYEKIQLDIGDGCVVETLEDAFPTVLEIIRNCPSVVSYDRVTDQAGRCLKELSNFKVIIKKPSSKVIPAYYEEEQERYEEYYQNVFGDENGFFQKHLCKDGQYEAVIKHIVNLISEDGLKYASRRAILVVPHTIDNSDDITPLGLVAVYIAPRMSQGGIVLDYSFSWRTVEAVVGFPYSLYGSIKYAEKILATVQNRCVSTQRGRIKMGTVSYMAYSLHMFMDDSYTQIVRGIVNNASE